MENLFLIIPFCILLYVLFRIETKVNNMQAYINDLNSNLVTISYNIETRSVVDDQVYDHIESDNTELMKKLNHIINSQRKMNDNLKAKESSGLQTIKGGEHIEFPFSEKIVFEKSKL